MGWYTPSSLWLFRRLFGKQEGDKLWNAWGLLIGVIGLVLAIVSRSWWFAALAFLVAVGSGVDLLRERRQPPDPSDDQGLAGPVGEMVSDPPQLNPFHHEPLPPFPSAPDDQPK